MAIPVVGGGGGGPRAPPPPARLYVPAVCLVCCDEDAVTGVEKDS
jgi:hypothetical protein